MGSRWEATDIAPTVPPPTTSRVLVMVWGSGIRPICVHSFGHGRRHVPQYVTRRRAAVVICASWLFAVP